MWRRLIEPSAAIADLTERRQAELLSAALLFFVPLTLALAVVKRAAPPPVAFDVLAVACGMAVAYALSRTRHLRAAVWLTLATGLCGTAAVAVHDPTQILWPAIIGQLVLTAAIFLPLVQAIGFAVVAIGTSIVVFRYTGATIEAAMTGVVVELSIGGFSVAFAWYRDRLERDRRADLQARDAALAEARRLEAIGRLAGGIAHDFNNLLTVILSNATLIGRGRDAALHAAEIDAAGQRAAALVRQLLAFSRKQVMTARRIDLGLLVRELEPLLDRLLGDDVELVVDAGPEPWWVEIDPTQLEQVLLNLAANARDAMPSGGRFTVALRRATAELDSAGPREVVELLVSDSGTGMDADTLASAFEPFFTTKPAGQGTGLGLASVRGIIEQSGGTIAIDSAPGRGTRFTIHLPRGDGAAVVEPAGGAPPEAELAAPRATVLLVEDDEQVRAAVLAVLGEAGLDVVAASGALEARAWFAAAPDRFGALVSDVVMPEVSGPALAAELRRTRPGLPVVFLSGYSEQAIGARGPLLPGARFVAKPFEPADLLAALTEAITASDDGAPISATAPTSAAPSPAR
jgi:signal transduction histidine kinase/CheY-like chemotaxis protein